MKCIKLLAFLIISLSSGLCVAEPVTWCNNPSVGIQYNGETDRLPIGLSNLMFSSVGESSHAKLQVINNELRHIRRYLLVLDLTDEHGTHLLYLPFFNSLSRSALPKEFANRAWLQAHALQSNVGLAPKKQHALASASPFITAYCPKQATVEYVLLAFSDGSILEYGSARGRIDPLVVDSKPTHEVGLSTAHAVEGMLGLVRDGGVDRVELAPGSYGSADKLQNTLKGLKFSPSSGLQSADVPFILVAEGDVSSIQEAKEWVLSHRAVEVLTAKRSRDGSWWTISGSTAEMGVGSVVLSSPHDH